MTDRAMDRCRGALLGLAVGDAVGTTLEFQTRGSFDPITDMIGGGPFHLKPGQWTDDTSMALCLAASLITCGGFDAQDQMERYVRWWRTGYFSSTGTCFDIGNTTAAALARFEQVGNPMSGSTDPLSAGNGSIMRLAPVPIFYRDDLARAVHFAGESSRTTHAAAECVDACKLFAALQVMAIRGASKEEILFGTKLPEELKPFEPSISSIARGSYRGKTAAEIRGSGYVVESLEAALWCFLTTESFEQAILASANLGDDADTTAAVCGQLAGAYYGATSIPEHWLRKLSLRAEIEELVIKLYRGGSGR